ncbi:MAG: hypothetical protein ACSLFD_01865 [Solirubrobacterales bacterium]
MLVLLGISTGIAIVTPAPSDDPPPEETAPPTGATGATGDTSSAEPRETDPADPGLIEASVSGGKKPKTVKASPGDRLVLEVDPGRPSDLEITGLGLTGTTTAYAPAVFDVQLPPEPGRFKVVEVGGKKELAVIETVKD